MNQPDPSLLQSDILANANPLTKAGRPSLSQVLKGGCPTLPAFFAGGWALARSTIPTRSRSTPSIAYGPSAPSNHLIPNKENRHEEELDTGM